MVVHLDTGPPVAPSTRPRHVRNARLPAGWMGVVVVAALALSLPLHIVTPASAQPCEDYGMHARCRWQ